MSISIDRLREVFALDESTGVLRWNIQKKRVRFGDVAGGISGRGYVYVGLDGLRLKAHRIVFAMVHGCWPDRVDHINGIKTDNRPENLRAATHAQNMQNAKTRSDNTSGFKGVTWDKRAKRWQAQISVAGRCKFLGYYDDAKEAAEVAREARIKQHREFARHA
jgi:hypothetical protein